MSPTVFASPPLLLISRLPRSQSLGFADLYRSLSECLMLCASGYPDDYVIIKNIAARTVDNVVYHIPSTVPTSSPHSARTAHNISPVLPNFSPEGSQEQRLLRISEEDLRFVEMDNPSQRVPFMTDSR
ncbi:WD40 repeat domain 95 [Datura stramonium]|uniref:WD40 repeat domain 95 n=1 Tax=Datura stramonium TaxID=4076 RepID=A0ABS8WFY4_DATST|nr:WD40 repeat domain 95 [Datura stramonium]